MTDQCRCPDLFGVRLSTNSRMAFSTMYDKVRSSASASDSMAASSRGSTRADSPTFFSDSDNGFRGMGGSVAA